MQFRTNPWPDDAAVRSSLADDEDDLDEEDLKDDDQETVIQACTRLSTVALALGPQRARTELVAFLTGRLRDFLCLADPVSCRRIH